MSERRQPMYSTRKWQKNLNEKTLGPRAWKRRLQERTNNKDVMKIANDAQRKAGLLISYLHDIYEMTAPDKEWKPDENIHLVNHGDFFNNTFESPSIKSPIPPYGEVLESMYEYFTLMFPEYDVALRHALQKRDIQTGIRTVRQTANGLLQSELSCPPRLIRLTYEIHASHHALEYTINAVAQNEPYGEMFLRRPIKELRTDIHEAGTQNE